jgi:hypothetical protein
MRRRLWACSIGAIAGLGIGLLLWLVDLLVANGTHHLLGLVLAFLAGFGILSFLFPTRATDYIIQLLLGTLENGNL